MKLSDIPEAGQGIRGNNQDRPLLDNSYLSLKSRETSTRADPPFFSNQVVSPPPLGGPDRQVHRNNTLGHTHPPGASAEGENLLIGRKFISGADSVPGTMPSTSSVDSLALPSGIPPVSPSSTEKMSWASSPNSPTESENSLDKALREAELPPPQNISTGHFVWKEIDTMDFTVDPPQKQKMRIKVEVPNVRPVRDEFWEEDANYLWFCNECFGFWVDMRSQYHTWWVDDIMWQRRNDLYQGDEKTHSCNYCCGVRRFWRPHWPAAKDVWIEHAGNYFDGTREFCFIGSNVNVLQYPSEEKEEGEIIASPPGIFNSEVLGVMRRIKTIFIPNVKPLLTPDQLEEWEKDLNTPDPGQTVDVSKLCVPSYHLNMVRTRSSSAPASTRSSSPEVDQGYPEYPALPAPSQSAGDLTVYCDNPSPQRPDQDPQDTRDSDHDSDILPITQAPQSVDLRTATLQLLDEIEDAHTPSPPRESNSPPKIMDSNFSPGKRLGEGVRRPREHVPIFSSPEKNESPESDQTPPGKLRRKKSPSTAGQLEVYVDPPAYQETENISGLPVHPSVVIIAQSQANSGIPAEGIPQENFSDIPGCPPLTAYELTQRILQLEEKINDYEKKKVCGRNQRKKCSNTSRISTPYMSNFVWNWMRKFPPMNTITSKISSLNTLRKFPPPRKKLTIF